MKRFNFKLMAALAMYALVAIATQAQVTPQAVIGNAPALPSPEQWAANNGHTEAFMAKINELNGKLNEMSAIQLPTVTEADMQQAQDAMAMPSLAAVSIAAQYLNITASEPEINL